MFCVAHVNFSSAYLFFCFPIVAYYTWYTQQSNGLLSVSLFSHYMSIRGGDGEVLNSIMWQAVVVWWRRIPTAATAAPVSRHRAELLLDAASVRFSTPSSAAQCYRPTCSAWERKEEKKNEMRKKRKQQSSRADFLCVC